MKLLIYTFLALFLFSFCSCSLKNSSDCYPRETLDKRLLGKWQSDRERTLEWISNNRKFTQEKIDRLDSAVKFGTMVVEITDEDTTYTYSGESTTEKNRVLGQYWNGIAFVIKNSFSNSDEISIITIEDNNSYSVYTGWADIREYFKKIEQ